jgi:predicted dehydrogenase
MKPLRLALIGVGHMGRFHAEKLAALARTDAGVELAVLVDRHLDRARAVGTATITASAAAKASRASLEARTPSTSPTARERSR